MRNILMVNLIVIGLANIAGPVSAGWLPSVSENAKDQDADITHSQVSKVIADFKNHYPYLDIYFEKAHGYAVFPTITKGGLGIGAAHGKGEVYEQGKFIGTADVKQITFGAQFGGQQYSEIIFFKDKATLEDFKASKMKLGAQASAIAATSGVSADAAYSEGVAVTTLAKTGLMYEATIAGQKFTFKPR
ncbi:MAG: hypothetical protein DCC43_09430 [Candidatus Brocadia sp.]|nr:hypothetical protein [Candidatus Brocadia fulgida]MCC6325977.1 lipid-binding SYLF domain-containing protein [Candidatus Brocadia sp.]MCE7911983.1 hypothetical protein [Candidatus Brocadia sp. AMX3]MDG5997410.1 hypothetical protein [Candidatus Brocadia sp.]RIJ98661.1 MAG: hypothetical protein DCC43_09430 [Candidatus Brocadia sp.]